MDYDIVPVEDWHIDYVAENMRESDKQQSWIQGLLHPKQALKYCVRTSKKPMCGVIDGFPAIIFGVASYSMIGSIGSPWMLSTSAIHALPISFLKECKKYIKESISSYDKLENYVDVENKTSISWLKWLGFDILDAEPYGNFKLPFHKFTMENEQ